MTSRRLPCQWALLLLFYVGADFMDPSIPGAFFFDSEELFIDGAVQAKSQTSRDLAVTEPTRFGDFASVRAENVDAAQASTRPPLPRPTHWKVLKRDDSASFASSASPDSSPAPRLS